MGGYKGKNDGGKSYLPGRRRGRRQTEEIWHKTTMASPLNHPRKSGSEQGKHFCGQGKRMLAHFHHYNISQATFFPARTPRGRNSGSQSSSFSSRVEVRKSLSLLPGFGRTSRGSEPF